MVRIGIVGIGFMGMIHYLAARGLTGARVAAICSRDRVKLAGDWRSIRGNFGPPGQIIDLGDMKRYERLEDLIADPEIDLIDVCNPTHLHPATAIAALRAGKNVLVEKAIALNAEEADEMLAAARESGKLLMVAHVLPFVPEFRYALEVVRGGQYGKLLAAHLERVISKPDWSADIADAAKTGGPAVDLHIHDTHFIGLMAGVPNSVFSTGRVEGDVVTYLTTSYLYGPEGPAVTCSSGAVATAGRPFAHGYEIYLEAATLSYNSDGKPLTVYTPDGKSFTPELPGAGDPIEAFSAELQAATEAVRTGTKANLLSGTMARNALLLCLRECESVRLGKAVMLR